MLDVGWFYHHKNALLIIMGVLWKYLYFKTILWCSQYPKFGYVKDAFFILDTIAHPCLNFDSDLTKLRWIEDG